MLPCEDRQERRHLLSPPARRPRRPVLPDADTEEGVQVLARADPDTLHAVYTALLSLCPPSDAHRADLTQRGLPDTEIGPRAYGTVPAAGRRQVLHELGSAIRTGHAAACPWNFIDFSERAEVGLAVKRSGLLMVPVRDTAGRIASIKARPDDCSEPDPGRRQAEEAGQILALPHSRCSGVVVRHIASPREPISKNAPGASRCFRLSCWALPEGAASSAPV